MISYRNCDSLWCLIQKRKKINATQVLIYFDYSDDFVAIVTTTMYNNTSTNIPVVVCWLSETRARSVTVLMLKYVGKRLLIIIPTLILIVFLIFCIMSFIPSSPGRIILGMNAKEEQVIALNT